MRLFHYLRLVRLIRQLEILLDEFNIEYLAIKRNKK
jgi:hypothetical protein